VNKEYLNILKSIQNKDQDKSFFYIWDLIPKNIQIDFIKWCKKYMQVDHEECFGGWEFGWSKYHEGYIEYLENPKKFLKDIGY